MYCPQCGGTNDDSARFCTTCGLDMESYKKQWQQPAASETGQPPAPEVQQPHGQQSYGPPPYQQQQYPTPYQGQQYQPAPGYGTMPNVPSHMVWAILTLILCFWPTGIVAVVYASQVGNKLAVGDYAGAVHSSKRAKLWSWISFAVGVFWIVIAVIIVLIAAAASITVY